MTEQEKQKVEEQKPAEDLNEVTTSKKDISTEEKPADEKKEKPKKKKAEKKQVPKKEEAVAYGRNLHISKKHGMYICAFIKNKEIDNAIADLEQVRKMKKAVPFKGEIPHRKGKGMMSGRYPVKAAGLFINLLKALKGNSIVNGLELEKTRIYFASASWSARPTRSNRRQGKRTNIILKAKEVVKEKEK